MNYAPQKNIYSKMKKIILYIIVFNIILLVNCTKKQGTGDIGGQIYGKVTLEEEENYSNIDIVLRNSDTEEIIREYTTTENGSYEFTDLEEGNYQLEFSSNRDDYENKFIKNLQIVGNRRIPIPETQLRIYTIIEDDDITEDTVWKKVESPYYIDSRVTVNEGVILTIEPGTEMKFDRFGELNVQGMLKAIGADGDTIVFTSSNANPEIGDWIGIYIVFSFNSVLEYTKVEYADIGIKNEESFAQITNCRILFCGVGIFSFRTEGEIIMNNIIKFNDKGIYLRSCKDFHIENTLLGNFLYDIDIRNSLGNNNIFNNEFRGDNGIRFLRDESFFNNIHDNIFYNKKISIQLIADSYAVIKNNNFETSQYFVYSDFYAGYTSHGAVWTLFQDEEDIDATENWWGMVNPSSIENKIWDQNDNVGEYSQYIFGYVVFEPFLYSENTEAGPK